MQSQVIAIAKAAADFGGIGVLAVALVLLYRLLDKFGGQFLKATQEQTVAMTQQAAAVTSLVETVKEGQNDQREVLIAVRMQSEKIDRLGKYLEAIDDFVREKIGDLVKKDSEQDKGLAKVEAVMDAVMGGKVA